MRRKLKRKSSIDIAAAELDVGAALTREWQGVSYRIDVVENGFEWDGTIYPSLSAVACAITGTRWNGPRFFGLRKASK